VSVLVVGGAGFVGLNVAEQLLSAGRAVRILDRGPPPDAALAAFARLPGELSILTGDVRDAAAVGEAVAGVRDVVFGAAITSAPEREATEPSTILEVNLNAFLAVLDAARAAGVRRVVNLSSAGAYGRAAFLPGIVTEERPVDPESLYSLTKFATERVGARMAALWGMDVVSVRLSAVFGRWERRTGVRDTPTPQFQIMEAAAAGASEVLLPGDIERDWIYGPDAASAIVAVLDAGRLTHGLYNVSTGSTFGVVAWGEAFAAARGGLCVRRAAAGEGATIGFVTPPPRSRLSVERLFADTAFRPAFGLDASARDAAAWMAATAPA